MSLLSSLRALAESGDSSLLYEGGNKCPDCGKELDDCECETDELDEAFIQECMSIAAPMYIQTELCENAEYMDTEVRDAFMKVQDYMVGQGMISEATVNLNNPKITVVKLSKESQIKRLKTIIALKLARKNNDSKYKKYKLGAKIKKENLAEIMKKYGTRADKLARKLWAKNAKNRKMNAVVSEKKGKK